jgi:hypothetical protein
MALDPLGPIVITSREVYDAVVRLTGRVDVLISQQSATQSDVADHESRLRALERARWPLPSLAALLAIGSLGVSLFLR